MGTVQCSLRGDGNTPASQGCFGGETRSKETYLCEFAPTTRHYRRIFRSMGTTGKRRLSFRVLTKVWRLFLCNVQGSECSEWVQCCNMILVRTQQQPGVSIPGVSPHGTRNYRKHRVGRGRGGMRTTHQRSLCPGANSRGGRECMYKT